MAGQVNGGEGQAALGVGAALESGTSSVELGREVRRSAVRQRLDGVQALVVWHVEVVDGAGGGLEALRAVPRHVLDREQRAVGEEKEIQQAVADDGVVGALDDGGEGSQSGRHGLISIGEEVGTSGAHEVVGWRHVELGLDIAPVKVVVRACGEGRESHLV